MIAVDLGCCPHEGDLSIEPLVARYEPDVLYGFDPLLRRGRSYHYRGTRVVLTRRAAWTRNGTVRFGVGAPSQLDATALVEKNDRNEWSEALIVPCFDFAKWLFDHGPAVVKMNIEGGEFPLLEHLIETGAVALISELIVAWHDERLGGDFPRRRAAILEILRCPVEEWTIPAFV